MIGRDFITAGNATFTLSIPDSFATQHDVPDHYTFRIRRKEANGDYPEVYFVSLLTGPDNTSDYSYLGMLDVRTGDVRLTKASKQTEDSMCVRLLRRTLSCLYNGEMDRIANAGFALHHEGKCGRCGRLLTVPESIESGIGPECAKIMCRTVA